MNRYLIFFFLFFAVQLQAKTAPPGVLGTVTGTVIDKQLQEPVPYASITVRNPAGEIVTGTVTAEDGSFSLEEISEGTFTFQVQFMGYQTYSEEITISKEQSVFHMGNIYLEPNVDQLDDVNVVAERSTIEQRIDRKVINVGRDLTTMGPTAAEIMNNIPSVSVDQDGNIALRGSQNVKVLVDGKPSNMDAATLLKTIPSTSIKKIELITNPSAKYDPEGMSGIINIILHKNTNMGFNGNFSGGITLNENFKSTASLNLNYRPGKFNFYTNLGFNSGENSLEGFIRDVNTGATEYPDLIFGRNAYLFKAGADYYMDERNTFSFYTSQNLYDAYGEGVFAMRYPLEPSRNYVQILDMNEENISSTYNFVYLHDFEKDGHNLQFEVDHNHYTNDEDSFFDFEGENAPVIPFAETVDKIENTTLANLDYVNPLTETTKLEVGAEARIRRTENDFETDNVNLEDIFYTYDRNIYSFYSTYGQELGKWAYQVGARLENYNVEAVQEGEKVYEDDYLTLYPSAFVTFTPEEKNSFQLSYSRRVDRPSLDQVNPVRQLSTPRLTVVGNPELQPQFTNSFEFNYTRKFEKARISTALFYRMITDEINQVVQQDPENPEHIILTFHNSGENNAYGAEISGSFEPFKFWDLNADFNVYSQTLNGYLGTLYVEEENTFYSLQANNTFKVTDQFRLQLFGMYRSPVKTLQFQIEEHYFVNLGARYSFWDDRASVSVNLNDIFDTRIQQFSTTRPTPQVGRLKNDSRSVYIGLSYRFGGGQNKALQRKQREDNTAEGGVF